MARIDITGLGKDFAGVAALRSLDLAIEDGQFITLLGPSGCGKTTTLRLLAGFMEPDRGRIEVDGAALSAPGACVAPERRGMGMVFQTYALWPHMTVFDNVAFGLSMQRVPAAETRRRVEEMLSSVGLEGMGARSPSALSGGQQQRVALARSLVTRPGILLLDEPLSNLDATLRERMRRELKDLQRHTGITFVYVTHDQGEALAMSDRIAVLRGGTLQQYGTPLDIYERPANRFVADFMGAANLLEGRVEQAESGQCVVALDGGGRFTAALRHAAGPGDAVALMLRPEDVAMLHAEPAAAGNSLRATVLDSTLLGAVLEYRLQAGPLVLRAQAPRGMCFTAGAAVWLCAPPDRCIALA
jgi:iron(III) transport system ATP-binding protein